MYASYPVHGSRCGCCSLYRPGRWVVAHQRPTGTVRAAESRVLSTTPDYLTETLEAVEGVCPLLTAFISGDVATIRGFVAESVALGKSGEYELAKHIAEEELPALP